MTDYVALNRLRAARGLGPIGTKDNSDQRREKKKKDDKAAKKKKKKKPNVRGESRREINKQLKKIYPKILQRDPICKIQSPVCLRVSTVVNHTKGRGINEVLDEKLMEGCCPPCNGYIESHPEFDGGKHKISPHIKPQKEEPLP
jgi:hypothetical protein